MVDIASGISTSQLIDSAISVDLYGELMILVERRMQADS
jgi:hypothetical protein